MSESRTVSETAKPLVCHRLADRVDLRSVEYVVARGEAHDSDFYEGDAAKEDEGKVTA